MSLFKNIGRAIGTAARQVGSVASAASFIPGVGAIGSLAKGVSALAGSGGRPQTAMPPQSLVASAVPFLQRTLPALPALSPAIASAAGARGILPTIAGGALGGAVTGVINNINRIAGGSGATQQGGCGCNGRSGRDPCTGQRMSSQPAPLATFFGGCCPPGRVLRRVNNGRDICARKARMNPFNPQALARADRRVTTFARRATPILRDLGFQVSRSRKPKISIGKKRRRG